MESGEGLKWRSNPSLNLVRTKRAAMEHKEVSYGGVVEEIVNVGEDEPLSPSATLFHEPNFNVYIIAIMGCKTLIDPDVVKPNLVHTLLKHPRFSSLQVVDENSTTKMKWVRTTVDLNNHVIVPDINPNLESPDEFIEDYISNLTKTTIDKSQPLWDLHLLNVKTSEAEAVGVFRIHHSIGDGTSLMSLLLACTRQMSDQEALPTIPVKKKRVEEKKKGLGRLWSFAMEVWWAVQLVWNTTVDVLMYVATVFFLKDTRNPLKGPPGVEFTPRRFVWKTVSLDDMKLVKNAMNTTINDVALGMTQAGLSRYLNRRYGGYMDEEEPTQAKNNLPKNIRLRSTLLINIRPAAGIQALADMMEKNTEAKWGNWIGFVLLPFKIGIRDDPLDYVREAKSTIDRKKHSLEAICTFSISELFLKLFGIKASADVSHRVISHTTLCFSNVVGPVEEIGYYGHPMAYLAPSSFNQPQGLMINFQSYVNKMTVVLSVDEDTIPDPHQLCDDIVASLRLIKDAVISRGLAKNNA